MAENERWVIAQSEIGRESGAASEKHRSKHGGGVMSNPLLQISPFDSDGGQLIGRDPRSVPPDGWRDRPFVSGLTAIRAKCLDCALDPKEVRKCVQTDCPLWPLRMGCVPKGYRMAAMRPKTSDKAPAAPFPLAHAAAKQNPSDEKEFE